MPRWIPKLKGEVSRNVATALILIEGIVLLLPILKIVEVWVEPEHILKPAHEKIGVGFLRRLDDITFWILISHGLASALILRACDQNLRTPPRASIRWGTEAMITLFMIMALLWGSYLWGTWNEPGGLFWKPGSGTLKTLASNDYRLTYWKWIKFIEGGLMVIALGSSALCCSSALILAQCVARTKDKAVAKLLLLASVTAPFAATFFFVALAFVVKALTDPDKNPTNMASGVGQIVIYSLPYLALLGWCRWSWRNDLQIALGLDFKIVTLDVENRE